MAYSDPFDPAVVPVVLSSPQATAAPVSAPVPAPVLPAPAPPPAGVPLGPLPAPAPPPGTLAPWSPVGAGGAARPVISGASPELNTAIEELKGDIANRERLAGERRTAEAPLIEQWLLAIATLAGVMGGRGRTHAVNAMSAMTGIVEGLAEGNRQKFEQSAKQWDMENKRITEINTQSRQAYLDEMNNRKLRAEEIDMRLRLTAQRYDDKIAESLIGNKEKLFSLIQARDQLNQTASEYTSGVRGLASRLTPSTSATDFSVRAWFNGMQRDPGTGLTGAAAKQAADARAEEYVQAQAVERGVPVEQILDEVRGRFNRQQGDTRFETQTAATLATRLAILENAERKLQKEIPDVLAASDALPRGRWVPVNRIVNRWLNDTSNPAYHAFAQAAYSLAFTYAQAKKPTGVLDVTLREEAIERMSLATSREAFATVVNQMVRELYRDITASKEQRAGTPVELPAVPGAYVPPGQPPIPGQPVAPPGGGGAGATPYPGVRSIQEVP